MDERGLLPLLPVGLCAPCVGRVFARSSISISNSERGRSYLPEAPEPGPDCPLCEGISGRIDTYADFAARDVAGLEFATFLVGSVIPAGVRAREAELFERLAEAAPEMRRAKADEGSPAPVFAPAEYLKAEVNRETGKRLESRLGKRVDFQRPDVVVKVDTRFDHIGLEVRSLYLRGRYRKHDRTMPQTKWPCRSCNGMGCRACEFRGKTYATSVEELVAAPFVVASGATGESFHGMGREDIDALMLGTGRPFVLELKEPRLRTLDLAALAAAATAASGGRVEALEMAPASGSDPARFKDADPEKTYRARCVAERPVPPEALARAVAALEGANLDQRTPERVAHRRSDLVRNRTVKALRALAHEGERFEIEVRAESGTYIKEFVSGDEGRTRPSLSEALGVPTRVVELDVVDVAWRE